MIFWGKKVSLCGNFLSNFSSAKSGAARDLPLIVLVGFFNSVSCFLKTFFLDFVLKQKEVCCCGLESIWNFIFDLQKWFWILFSPIYFLRKNKICITLLMKCIPTLTWGYGFFPQALQNICFWWLSNLIIDELERNDYMYMCTHRH